MNATLANIQLIPYFRFGVAAVVAGSFLLSINMALWFYILQFSLSLADSSSVLRYFAGESAALAIIVGGLVAIYKGLQAPPAWGSRSPSTSGSGYSLRRVISDVLSSKADVRLGALGAVLYAAFYSVVSTILVYQPGVDFASVYGVSKTSWLPVVCCGDFGTTPMMVVYLLPQFHLGLQIIPLDLALAPYQLLFVAISIPVLVVSPLVIANNLRKSLYGSCKI